MNNIFFAIIAIRNKGRNSGLLPFSNYYNNNKIFDLFNLLFRFWSPTDVTEQARMSSLILKTWAKNLFNKLDIKKALIIPGILFPFGTMHRMKWGSVAFRVVIRASN